jgi:hypothetical protein
MRNYLNSISGYYDDSETLFHHQWTAGRDGEALIFLLKQGLRYEEVQAQGVIDPEDFDRMSWRDA